MRKFLLFILFSSYFVNAFAFDEDFRVYKKPLLPGIEIAQTDTHTELLYR